MDLKNAPPMEERQLVTYINHFITSTVTFLNNFMVHCDGKLIETEQRLQKVTASLCILETKLNSVPELNLKEKQQCLTNKTINTQIENNQATSEVKENSTKNSNEQKLDTQVVTETVERQDSTIEVEGSETHNFSADPSILKYRKMLQVGVPRGAVELKMTHSGLDPKLL
ncbi:WASH complex subunit 3 [Adelges cooleyi]|uniref:WASH complex subunit 3 n=1 Tax=Adelges cooleyi TaxID=133065 RepID=UPI00217F4D77|nr:WASH complex subunit 3 [Adelges cooleyi]